MGAPPWLEKTGRGLSYVPIVGVPQGFISGTGPYARAGAAVGRVGARIGHAVDVPSKLNQAAGKVGGGLASLGAGYGAGVQSAGRGLGGAFEGAIGGVGRGLGEAAYYGIGGIGAGVGAGAEAGLGGIASGIGGGVSTAASGLGEGVKSLALPVLLIIGALFLYKKVK